MARKNADGRTPTSGQGSGIGGDPMFGDKRSPRDRREENLPTAENRRKSGERRKAGGRTQTAWWLERGYVESHHFVQKSTASRETPAEDDSSRE